MPILQFRLTSKCLTLEVDQMREDWKLSASALCSSFQDSFRLSHGGRNYDGNGSQAHLSIRSRPSRVESPGIDTGKPYDPEDKHRDIVRVDFLPERDTHQPYIQLTISLPEDAYHRLADTDLRITKVLVVVENEVLGQALVYGEDPDGRDIVWNADEAQHLFLQRVTVHFVSPNDADSPRTTT